MAYGYRRRRYRRRSYRRRFRASRRPRRYRRSYRNGKTKSSVVKLTYETNWTMAIVANGTATYAPFTFTPNQLPGFADYMSVYQKFRFVGAKLDIATPYTSAGTATLPYNYLMVGSRPFAETNPPPPAGNPSAQQSYYFTPQTELELRQTRWQKVKYPSHITQKVSAKFRPYTLIAGFGPQTNAQDPKVWQRTWEGSKWTPFTWTQQGGLAYFGPFCVVSGNNYATDTDTTPVTEAKVTLTAWVKFCGQK